MRPYRDIATVAALQVVRFPGRAHFEPQFFLLYLYQTIVYVALLILLFYREDARAYMDGMLTPIAWLGMLFASGLLGACNASGSPLQAREGVTNEVSVIGWRFRSPFRPDVCFLRAPWKREYAGPGKTATTFATSVGAPRSTTESWRSGFRT